MDCKLFWIKTTAKWIIVTTLPLKQTSNPVQKGLVPATYIHWKGNLVWEITYSLIFKRLGGQETQGMTERDGLAI